MRYAVVLLCILSSPSNAAGNTAFINEVPDFTRTDVTGTAYWHGRESCVPAAVASSLYWIADTPD